MILTLNNTKFMELVWGLRDTIGQNRITICSKFTYFSNKFSERISLLIIHKTFKQITQP